MERVSVIWKWIGRIRKWLARVADKTLDGIRSQLKVHLI